MSQSRAVPVPVSPSRQRGCPAGGTRCPLHGARVPRGWDTGALALVTSSDTSSPGRGVDRWGTAVPFSAVGPHVQQGSPVGQLDPSRGSFPCVGQLCTALGNSAAHPSDVHVF